MKKEEFFKELTENLKETADVRKVFGEPVTLEKRTIIPVAEIKLGVGGGGSIEDDKNKDEKEEEKKVEEIAEAGEEKEEVKKKDVKIKNKGGMGGGAGAKITPIGYIELTPEGSEFKSIHSKLKLIGVFAAGYFASKIIGKIFKGK